MSEQNTQPSQKQTTTHYWGYRELDASELKHVAGGDEGGGDNGGDADGDGDGPGDGCDFGDGFGGGDGPSWPVSTTPNPGSFFWDGFN
jgi:hypothetical protein